MNQVDIILPVRDAALTIAEAVESILGQTFRDFKLIIVDDGSTDETPVIIADLKSRDSRVHVVTGERTGIVAALNLGLASGHAPLVARMDADDIAICNRLSRQVDTFAQRPNLVLLGTRIEWFGTKHGRPAIVIGAKACRIALGIFTPFCHPSVMMRRAALNKLERFYDPHYEYSEDWELFSRLSKIGEVDNLADVLLRYRVHDNQISNTKKQSQISFQKVISEKHQHYILGINGYVSEFIFWLKAFIALQPPNWRQLFRALRRRVTIIG